MNITEYTFKNKIFSYFVLVMIIVLGVISFMSLGQLEDPDFSVKSCVITTLYPGASPEEVELEVTDRIEQAIQEMPQVNHIHSYSRAGVSTVKIDIKQNYWAKELPQVWDDVRKKVKNITPQLPPGVQEPIVGDDFNFVYGFVLAVTGEGYSYRELESISKAIKKELSLVTGVSRVEFWGIQDRAIFIDISEQQLAQSGINPKNFQSTLNSQNLVVDAGYVDVQSNRIRIAPTGEFRSVNEIGDLYLHPTNKPTPQQVDFSTAQTARPTEISGSTPSPELIRIKDVSTVVDGYQIPPKTLFRFNQSPAIAIALANVAGGNIVDTGKAIEKRLQEIMGGIPVGIEVRKVAWQSDEVSKSVNDFLINLIEAVLIVLIVLAITMGFRMGIIIGSCLILTIFSVFILMKMAGIDLHRISLGALIIALGMMVDNAIVVADGIMVRLNQGMDRMKACIESATLPLMPLLGATIVASMAFYPIYGSKSDTGEYAGSLFVVVGMSLLMSWLIAITLTPLQCYDMLPNPKKEDTGSDQYNTRFFNTYRRLLEISIRFRWSFLICMVGLLIFSFIGFGSVKKMFFPESSRPQLMVDFWYPQGTKIQQVSQDIQPTESFLKDYDGVTAVSSFIGAGPPRFYLPVEPEMQYPNYAQIIVNFDDFRKINPLIEKLQPWLNKRYPDALTRIRKYAVGPGNAWKFEWHISGPAEASLAVLRGLGDQGADILLASPLAKDVKTVMMNQVPKIVPEYDQINGRWLGVQREAIASATSRIHDGERIGIYRERDQIIPIFLRSTEEQRKKASLLEMVQVQPSASNYSVPLTQVAKKITTEWEDPIIFRWDRRRANTVQGEPNGTTYPDLKDHVIEQFNQLKLPPYYEIYKKGEDQSTRDSRDNLLPGLLPAGVIMITILVALFNSIRTPLIIVFTIPFVVIGITWSLLLFNTPFGFMALLGGMSLSGMMIKNAVVLLDQIEVETSGGNEPYQAVMIASISRLRPVLLGAVTTVFGVAPLIIDVFWKSMTITIMGGLTFGTILTMFLVPVLYCILYKVNPQKKYESNGGQLV